MLNRIDKINLIYSFAIGAVIGLIAQLALNSGPDAGALLLCVLASGVIGLVVGLLVMFIMALMPVRIAGTKSYFIIGNLIALFITLAAIVTIYFIGVENFTGTDLGIVLAIAFPVIILANVLEYFKYKRTNRKLMDYIARKNRLT